MIAMSIPNRTIYDCSLFQKGLNMIAIIEIWLSQDSFRNHSPVGQISTLQSYLVPIGKDCNHMWTEKGSSF